MENKQSKIWLFFPALFVFVFSFSFMLAQEAFADGPYCCSYQNPCGPGTNYGHMYDPDGPHGPILPYCTCVPDLSSCHFCGECW